VGEEGLAMGKYAQTTTVFFPFVPISSLMLEHSRT